MIEARGYLELVVWESHSQTEDRRIATVRVFENGSVAAFEGGRNRKTVAVAPPRQAGESVWRVVERVTAVMAGSDEIGG
jgi:hypothetical protein